MLHEAVKVDRQDTFVAAVDDAMVRTSAIFGDNKKTLVDSIPQSQWDKWDASSERPNVADSALLADDDDLEEGGLSAA